MPIMKHFEVIFVPCRPCFVDFISDTMRLDNRPCFTSAEFVDFVKSARQGSFATETVAMSGTIFLVVVMIWLQLLRLTKRVVFITTEGLFLLAKLVTNEQFLESITFVIENH